MKKSLAFFAFAALLIYAGSALAGNADQSAGHEHSHGAPGEPAKNESGLTMLQVMHDLAFQLQRVQFGVMTQNRRMIEEGATAIANHPMPKGGIKPYLKKNQEQVKAVIPAMDANIHGTATDMASHASAAPMKDLQALYNVMAENCVSCHTVFRDQ
jgi:hypothetical protein